MSFAKLALGGGGGGTSASSNTATGPQRSGDIGGSTFGGINTGTQSSTPPWVFPVALAIAAIVAVFYFRRKA